MDSEILKQYIAIDLKSFYASVECVERGLDPLDTCLVVADPTRTEKTICLAVSPALKQYGLGGRPRLFEVVQKVREVNRQRGHQGKSYSKCKLDSNNDLALDYIVAKPRMAHYIKYSTRIYEVYMRYVDPEDVHVYSIDEVFIDATPYLSTYKMTAHELAMKMIREVLAKTGITATAGIGTNMYLCKIAMDIVAKKMQPDKDGVRIAELDEMSYRRQLWEHTPLTDFWRVGRGIANRLTQYGIITMGDIARCSLEHEDFLYKLFGVNAELLIDHAWGWEPVTMDLVRAYRPDTRSMSSGQVLHYGRKIPVHAHGTTNIEHPTSSGKILMEKIGELFDRIINPDLLVRRLTLSINHLVSEVEVKPVNNVVQLDLFPDYEKMEREKAEKERLAKERRRQEAVIQIKKKFGKNSILTGLNYSEGATQKERNQQIGGHHE